MGGKGFMSNRQISISIRQIKIFSGIFIFLVLSVVGFAISEGRGAVQASEAISAGISEDATPSAFLPGDDTKVTLLNQLKARKQAQHHVRPLFMKMGFTRQQSLKLCQLYRILRPIPFHQG